MELTLKERKKLTRVTAGKYRKVGKLLAPFVRANIDAIAGEPRFAVSNGVRKKLGRISAASIDRLLRKEMEDKIYPRLRCFRLYSFKVLRIYGSGFRIYLYIR